MEKISALIEKLQELKNSNADLQTISYYVQLLQAEVLHARNKQHQHALQAKQSHISVIMPSQNGEVKQPPVSVQPDPPVTVTPVPEKEPAPVMSSPKEEVPVTPAPPKEVIPVMSSPKEEVPVTPAPPKEVIPVMSSPKEEVPVTPAPSKEVIPVMSSPKEEVPVTPAPPKEVIPVMSSLKEEVPVTPAATTPPAKDIPAEKEKKPAPATLFDDIPARNGNGHTTNGHTPEINGIRKELNELVSNATSLNDRLRQQKTELAEKLGDMPVNDLRHAIGINDKYQFIQELFRGDKDLYERSIKTINDFNSLDEADYWIQRELKIWQGWQDDHRLVKQFYTLLRKRFS